MKNAKSLMFYIFFTVSAFALGPGEEFVYDQGYGVQSTENYALPMVFDDCAEWDNPPPEKVAEVDALKSLGYQCNPQGPLVIADKTFGPGVLGSSKFQGIGTTAFTTVSGEVTEPCAYFNTYYDTRFRGTGLCQDGYNFGNALTILTVPQSSLTAIKDIMSSQDTGLLKENGDPLVLNFLSSAGFIFEGNLTAYAPQNYAQKLYLLRESDIQAIAAKYGKAPNSNFAYLTQADLDAADKWETNIIIKEAATDNVMRRFAEIKCRQIDPGVTVELFPAYGTAEQYYCKLTRDNLQNKVEQVFTVNKETPVVNTSCNEIYLNRGDQVLTNGVYQLTKTYKYYVYDNVQPYLGGGYFTVPHNPEIADGQYVYLVVNGQLYDAIWWDGKYRTLDERPVHVRLDGTQINPTFVWGGQQVIVIPKKHRYRAIAKKRSFVPVVNNRVVDVSMNSPDYPLTTALQTRFINGIADATQFLDSQFYFSINANAYCDMETDGGGWTLVASSVDRSVWKNMTFSDGANADVYKIPALLDPYINHTLYGSADTAMSTDYKGGGYLDIPFSEFMFKDSNSKWASYVIGDKDFTSVRDWYPEDTFWSPNGVEPREDTMKPNGFYLFKTKNTNVEAALNSCKSLDIGFNIEDSDTPYGTTTWHDYSFGPSWYGKNNALCYFDEAGLGWSKGGIFHPNNPTSYKLWFVRGTNENRERKLYSSCLEILNAGKSKGDGLYNLDIDGTGYPTTTFCNMSVSGGGWTLVAKFSNQDAKHWSNSAGAWVNDYIFGSPSSTAKQDMKNEGWSKIKARDMLFLTDNLATKAIWTNSGCAEDLSMQDFFKTAFAKYNFTNFNSTYRSSLGQVKYKTCKITRNYTPLWTRAYVNSTGGISDSVLNQREIYIARNDSYDSHGIISSFGPNSLEADAGLGALDWNSGFTTAGSSQDVGSPTRCGLNDATCRSMFPQTVYMYVREASPQDKLATRQYNSCAEIQATNSGVTLQNDYYYVFSRNKNIKTKVWCDFTVSPALTLFHKSGGITTRRYTDWDSCKEAGFEIFAPKNKTELLAGISYLEKEKGAPISNNREMGPLGVYNPFRNSTYLESGGWSAYTPMNSTSAKAVSLGWRSIRGNQWFMSDLTTHWEPNGNYYRNCWLDVRANSNGVTSYDDSGCNYSYNSYMCSTNENVEADMVFTSDPLVPLYSFTSHTFTNCGKVGPYGPSLSQCRNAYSTKSWSANPSFYTMSKTGYQTWTVPETGTYRIGARGARGGRATCYSTSVSNHLAAYVRGDFVLHKGDKLTMVIGHMGGDHCQYGGGGGGTFVTYGRNYLNSKLLLAAGGGGGMHMTSGAANSKGAITANGQYGLGRVFWSTVQMLGGTGGNGGKGDATAGLGRGGGGGFLTNGTGNLPGYAFRTGAYGANGCYGDGGFGGGSSTCNNHAGAGGGYSGGGSGYEGYSTAIGYGNGGGGGSYNSGANQYNSQNAGGIVSQLHGLVTIQKL